jgi:hypothetical protein
MEKKGEQAQLARGTERLGEGPRREASLQRR